MYLLKGFAGLALCMVATACSHEDFAEEQQTKEEEFIDNFQALVMGGKEVNPNQTWNTAVSTTIKVSVDLDYDAEYNVYIYQTAPLINKDAAFIGQVALKSGETKTITISRPAGTPYLYAACYDQDMHAICKTFVVQASGTELSFSNKTSAASRRLATTTGNRWSVIPRSMPDLDNYTTGTLYEMQEAYNSNGAGLEFNQADPSERHLIISGSYSGSIARIQSYANQSVYVTGTWTVPEDQRCTGNSVIVVGETGKIVIPSGCMLSTNANNEEGTTGMIYVMPGGVIEGDGTLQFSNGTQTYSYNAGTIKAKNININGGTLYNAGTIGTTGETNGSKLPYLTGPGGTVTAPSKFINLGQCTLDHVDGAGMSIENACNMVVINELAIGESSKMDDGSYIECGELTLNGSNNGDCVFFMGNSAYMNCLGNFATNNFGVWGPNGANSASTRALFAINGCANTGVSGTVGCNYTQGLPTTYMLDNVELILGSGYPDYTQALSADANLAAQGVTWALNAQHDYYRAALLMYGWLNGVDCKQVNLNNYEWADGGYVWKEGNAMYDVDESRATCIYGSSPSYTVTKSDDDNCGITITKGKDPDPLEPTPETPDVPANTNWVYYAFEDLGGTNDFDFNDVVIRVSTPVNGKSQVYIMACGGELNSYVTLDGNHFGSEVHAAMGAGDHRIYNTKAAYVLTSTFHHLGEITLSSGQTPATLPIGLDVLNSNGTSRNVIASRVNGTASTAKESYDKAPLYLVINGDANGKWFWPRERVNITTAFKDFSTWGSTLSEGTTWYMPDNALEEKVVSW